MMIGICYTNKKFKSLNYGLVSKKMHRIIKFNEKACLNPSIEMNIDLRKKSKNDFEKYFFELINNAVFEKKHGKCEKRQRCQVCNNFKKKELFSIRTKLSHNNFFS